MDHVEGLTLLENGNAGGPAGEAEARAEAGGAGAAGAPETATTTSSATETAEEAETAEETAATGRGTPRAAAEAEYDGTRGPGREKAPGEPDLVKVYLGQMSAIPPVSPDEERFLGQQLEEARDAYRDRVLQGGVPLGRAIELLDKVLARTLPVDRALLVDLTSRTAKQETLDRLEIAVPELKKIHRLNRRDFHAYVAPKTPSEERARLRKKIRARYEEAVRLMQPFNIQVSRFHPMIADVQDALRRMKSARRRYRALIQRRAADIEVRGAEDAFMEAQLESTATLKTLRRYLDEVKAAAAAYEEAKKQLSKKNLRLVVAIAKKFRGKGMPFLDIIQEGNTGLLKALDRYQASRGNKFSTYATWWIKQTITRSIAYSSRAVRVPIHAINNLNRLLDEKEQFFKREGRDPTLEEMATIAKLPKREVNRLFTLNRSSLSLDQPYGTDEEGQLGELIEDRKSPAPVQASQMSQLREHIQKILKTLSFREREVMKLRYGLQNGQSYTLEEVGQIFKVSRERIRQIEVGALQKLQLPVRRDKLKAFWEEINE